MKKDDWGSHNESMYQRHGRKSATTKLQLVLSRCTNLPEAGHEESVLYTFLVLGSSMFKTVDVGPLDGVLVRTCTLQCFKSATPICQQETRLSSQMLYG